MIMKRMDLVKWRPQSNNHSDFSRGLIRVGDFGSCYGHKGWSIDCEADLMDWDSNGIRRDYSLR